MKRRILLSGLALGAFIVTLAFSSWHEGLWHSAEPPPPSAAPRRIDESVVPAPVAATAPDASSEARNATPPAAAALNPPQPVAAPEASAAAPQYEQNANPGVDPEAMHRDRGVQHSSGPP